MNHTFRGQVRPRNTRRKKFSQDATRNPVIMTDQFGRQYSASTEQRSGMPTGLISPLFRAPWHVPQKYFIINPDNVAELYLDLGQMFADAKAENARYHKRATRLAGKKGWTTPIRGQYTEDITEALGEPPAPVEPIVALYQGNQYILGSCTGCRKASNVCVCAGGYKAPEPDPRLLPFMPQRHQPLEDEIEGLDFSEASRQRALRDAGLREVVRRGKRELVDIEESEIEGMDFGSEAPAGELTEFASEADLGGDEMPKLPDQTVGHSTEEAQTAVLERLGDAEMPTGEPEDDISDDLAALEQEVDSEATPRTAVPPQAQGRVARQAPRRETQSATRRKAGAHRSRVGTPGQKLSERPALHQQSKMRPLRTTKENGQRRTLADGAKAVVSEDQGE